jgi:hypothetical protein
MKVAHTSSPFRLDSQEISLTFLIQEQGCFDFSIVRESQPMAPGLQLYRSSLKLKSGGVMSDGREEREERDKRREQEEREDREDRLDRKPLDPWEPERVDS